MYVRDRTVPKVDPGTVFAETERSNQVRAVSTDEHRQARLRDPSLHFRTDTFRCPRVSGGSQGLLDRTPHSVSLTCRSVLSGCSQPAHRAFLAFLYPYSLGREGAPLGRGLQTPLREPSGRRVHTSPRPDSGGPRRRCHQSCVEASVFGLLRCRGPTLGNPFAETEYPFL